MDIASKLQPLSNVPSTEVSPFKTQWGRRSFESPVWSVSFVSSWMQHPPWGCFWLQHCWTRTCLNQISTQGSLVLSSTSNLQASLLQLAERFKQRGDLGERTVVSTALSQTSMLIPT